MKISRFLSLIEWRAPGSRAVLGLAFCTLALGACASDQVDPDRTAMLPEDQRVSSVPWNHPQGWENKSQLGALANDPRIGGQSSNSQRY